MSWTNEELSRAFAQIALLLRLSGGDSRRVRAYEQAAGVVAAAPGDLGDRQPRALTDLPGVGASVAAKIAEYRRTGRIQLLEDLRAQVPAGLVQLTGVRGIGPATALRLHEQLGVDSIEALWRALEAGQLQTLRGFGLRSEQRLRAALEVRRREDPERIPAADVLALAGELTRELAELAGVREVYVAGSLRRMRPDVGDLDLLLVADEPATVLRGVEDSALVEATLAAGDTRRRLRLARQIPADLRAVAPDSAGAALQYLTGSQAHNVKLRRRAMRRGWRLNEYALERAEDGARLAGKDEEGVYAALGLAFIPAPMREDHGEIEAAAAGTLPTVVTRTDLRGDLHGHSDWSGDGHASLEAMARAAAGRGLEYWAVSDHAERLAINGLSRERFLQRRRLLEALSGRVGVALLDAVELNIGIDGSVDFDPAFLAGFQLCVASVHSQLDAEPARQTARLLAAIDNPHVHVIGHPTGRKLGRRPGYRFDIEAVIARAAATGTALEVNASPRRLDLDGDLVRAVVDAGGLLTISSDAHSEGDLDSMPYGVATAQRGWARPTDVLNTRPLPALLAFLSGKAGRV